jgi:hypothetical protein
MEDIVEQAVGEVKRHTTWADVGGVESSARDTLVKLHQLLSLLESPKKRSESTNVHRVCQDGHQVWSKLKSRLRHCNKPTHD